jgi:hypothetical protein
MFTSQLHLVCTVEPCVFSLGVDLPRGALEVWRSLQQALLLGLEDIFQSMLGPERQVGCLTLRQGLARPWKDKVAR